MEPSFYQPYRSIQSDGGAEIGARRRVRIEMYGFEDWQDWVGGCRNGPIR